MVELSRTALRRSLGPAFGVSCVLIASVGCTTTGASPDEPNVPTGNGAQGMGAFPGVGGMTTGGILNGTGGVATGGAPSTGGIATGGGSTGGTGGGFPPIDCNRVVDTTTYAYDLNIPPSQNPPAGILPSDAPQFVSIGWDDNSSAEGMEWATAMLGARSVHNSFFYTSTYLEDAGASWVSAHMAGNESGLHTVDHPHGTFHSEGDWQWQVDNNIAQLEGGMGVTTSDLRGFRTPFLEYNDALFDVLKSRNIWYDTSIEEGFQADQDGTNFNWPYTLDGGSPGHDYVKQEGSEFRQFEVTSHPGVVELPVYALIIPPDEVAVTYGFEPGLRTRMNDAGGTAEWGHKVTGFDWNLWFQTGVSSPEVLAILKYNLDLRLGGNRAPLLFGAHTDNYTGGDSWRRAAIEGFLDYALTKPEVRVVTFKEVFEFMRNPKPLSCK